MAYLGLETQKPAKPLKQKTKYVFPKTTSDQVIVDEDTDKRLDETLEELERKSVDVTQAEYDALVAAGEIDDSVTYYITDAEDIYASSVKYGSGDVETELNKINSSLNGFGFDSQDFSDITNAYESIARNGLKFDGKNIYPNAFPNGVFLVILSSDQSVGVATAYVVILGATGTTNASVSKLSADRTDNYPSVAISTSGYAYVRWVTSTTANIKAGIFRLS